MDFFTWDPWANRSWSQEGEDIMLRRIFGSQRTGLYVDVGAHHPKRFSNTYFFYRLGWHGINIDAMPGSMRLFNKCRPRDINLELGIAQNAGTLNYFIFNETALNGFSATLSNQRNSENNKYYVKDVVKLNVQPLSEVLEKYADGAAIDFMTVDVEGLDLQVLRSNDWSRFRPEYVLAEVLRSSLDELQYDPVTKFMRGIGYSVYAKVVNTVIFKNVKSTV